jgi:hypothetical protein
MSEIMHDHGVPDVRATRRDAAERAGGRAAAAIVLRHRPGSKSTGRYAGTKDAIPAARRLARKVTFADIVGSTT